MRTDAEEKRNYVREGALLELAGAQQRLEQARAAAAHPRALMVSGWEAALAGGFPAGWGRTAAAGGIEGWMEDLNARYAAAQQEVCGC